MAVRMCVSSFGSKMQVLLTSFKVGRLHRMSMTSFHTNAILFGDSTKILMPSLSPTMTQGTIVKWYKAEGDTVVPGDLLCDIQTDKAVVGFEVEEEGILAKILKQENSANVQIGTLIALIVDASEDWRNVVIPTDASAGSQPTSVSSSESSPPPAAVPRPAESSTIGRPTHGLDLHSLGPSVRLLLEQYNVNLKDVTATGPHGRVLKGDVLKFIKDRKLSPVVVSSPPAPTPVQTPKPADAKTPPPQKKPLPATANYIDLELTNMRSVIAKRLTLSKTTIPHSYATIECTIDRLLEMRKRLASEGFKVGVNDFLIKAVAVALKKVPEMNAIWSGEKVQLLNDIDISVAVATDNGLITPIVKDAVSLGVNEISTAVKDLAARARAGKLKLNEFQGGSFTISNLGMFGITSFSAVINPPQACILAVGGSRLVPRQHDDGTLSAETVLTMTTASDARVIDDVLAASFLAVVREVMENPDLMLSHRLPAAAAASDLSGRYDVQKLFAK